LLNKTQKEYYATWGERDKIIDLITYGEALSVHIDVEVLEIGIRNIDMNKIIGA